MKRLLVALCALALGAALTLDGAEAARLGGGRSVGAQRAAPMQRQAQPAAAPAQQPNQAAQPATSPAQTPQPAPQGNRWLGPVAGLAAGLGLGWLLGQGGLGGLGGMLGSVMLMLLVAFAVMALLRLFARRNTQASPPLQYAGLGNETVAAPPPSQMPSAGAASQPDFRSQFQPQIPAGFDVDGFLRQAKLNFVRMQQANDRGEADSLRDMTTDDMFASLKVDLLERGGRPQQTDVVTLNASLLEVVTEGNTHWASVQFAGTIRETPGAAPTAFEEVWHLQKPMDGKTGWLLAGIRQPTTA
jgi:predicted lipid-binding transport protein (Tim44 family)